MTAAAEIFYNLDIITAVKNVIHNNWYLSKMSNLQIDTGLSNND